MNEMNFKQWMTILSIVGAMLTWNANAQVKVGDNPNTINAGSVLELESTDKGLLYPRVALTDLNQWAPLKGEAAEGMTVYNIGTTVAKGFYYWDGAKWVLIASVNDHIWKYQNDKVFIDKADIADDVYYMKEGGFRHMPKKLRKIGTYDNVTNSVSDVPFDLNKIKIANAYKFTTTYSDMIPVNYIDPKYPEKMLSTKLLVIDENEAVDKADRFFADRNSIVVNTGSTKNLTSIYSSVNSVTNYGQGDVGYMIGSWGVTNHDGTGSVRTMFGSYNQVSGISASDINTLFSSYNLFTLRGAGRVTYGNAVGNLIYLGSNDGPNSNSFHVLRGFSNYFRIGEKFKGSIENYIHFDASTKLDIGANASIKNMYGIRMTNINLGTEKNYAIWTSLGKVRFGDNVGVGVDNPTEKLEVSGKVKATQAIFTNLPVYDTDAAADADTNLPSGSLYKLKDKGRQVFVKP